MDNITAASAINVYFTAFDFFLGKNKVERLTSCFKDANIRYPHGQDKHIVHECSP